MKRRQELITAILEWLENRESPWSDLPTTTVGTSGEPVDPAVIKYHVDLCEQAGFVRIAGRDTTLPQIQLTWAGHEQIQTRRALRAATIAPETQHAA